LLLARVTLGAEASSVAVLVLFVFLAAAL